MLQSVEYINVSQKIEDKIAQMETRKRRKFTHTQKENLKEIFLSGMLFGLQYNRGEE